MKSKFAKLLCLGFTTSLFIATGHSAKLQALPDQQASEVNVSTYLKKHKPETFQFLQRRFEQSVNDTQKAEPSEIVDNLIALSTTNQKQKIRFRVVNGKTEFLMSTWQKIDSREKAEWKSRQGKPFSVDRYVWVTASPQVQEFCRTCQGLGFKAPGNIILNLRLQQYLGLKLETVKTHFVEMWVKAEDLIRPCVDEEINDSSCTTLPSAIRSNQTDLINLRKSSEGYPWTGLGYTYDWGAPNKLHEGASEFVIRQSTPQKKVEVEIASVTKTEDYCKNKFLMTSGSF